MAVRRNIKYKPGTKLKLVKPIQCSDFTEETVVEVVTAKTMHTNYNMPRNKGKGLVSVDFKDVYGYMYKMEEWIKI